MNIILKSIASCVAITSSAMTATAGTQEASPVIFCNVAASENDVTPTGIYSFKPDFDLEFEAVKTDPDIVGSRGAVYVDGKYEVVNMMSHYTYDTNGWERIHECRLGWPAMMEMAAEAVTWDPVTGNVYGCFLTTSQSYRIATVDYQNNSVMEIRDIGSDSYVACIFTDKQGILYGILTTGDLVRIDKTTGEFDVVGNLGMTPSGYQGAVCDPATGNVYWAASADGSHGLYEIDLSDASISLVAEFPNGEQVTGMYIITSPLETEEIPAMATDLVPNFANGSLSGTISFFVPENSESGTPLTGNVDYSVKIDDKEVASGAAEPGKTVTTSVIDIENPGFVVVSVVLSNTAGVSPACYKRIYAGFDIPEVPTGVQISLDKDKVSLTWTAPAAGLNGGWFDADNLKYDVIRYPDNRLVANRTDKTEWVDIIDSDDLVSYTYGIVAFNGDIASEEAVSESVIHGSVASIPYHEAFDRNNSLDLFTIEDTNGDGTTWGLNEWSPVLEYSSNTELEADDWAITPPLKLSANDIYRVSLRADGSSQLMAQNIDIAIGESPSSESMTYPIIENTEIYLEGSDLQNTFSVEKDGTYHIGIHTTTKAYHSWISVKNLAIEKIADKTGPATPEDFKAIPADKGELKVNLSLKVPAKSYDGNTIGNIKSLIISRDGVVIKEWLNPTAGQILEYIDEGMEEGMHRYNAWASSDKGLGCPASADVYTGIDQPAPVELVNLTENDGKVTLTWTPAARGRHGGYVDNSVMKYTIQRSGGEMIAKEITDRSFTETPPTYEDQYDLAYAIMAISDRGASTLSISPSLLWGDDYTLPFIETFANGETDYYWGIERTGNGNASLTNMVSLDGDGGCVVLTSEGDGSGASIVSGRISFAGSTYPELKFLAGLNSGKMTLNVKIQDSTGIRSISEYNLTKPGAIETISVPLQDYKDMGGIRVSIGCESGFESQVFIDNVIISEGSGIDEIDNTGNISIRDGAILINGLDGKSWSVVSASGIVLGHGNNVDSAKIDVTAGIYIVTINGRPHRLIVK